MSASDKPDVVSSDDGGVAALIRPLDHAFPFVTAERVLARIYTIAVFRRRFAHLGTGTFISPYVLIQGMRFLSVGDSTGIHRASRLLAFDRYAGSVYDPRIVIGDRVHIGHGCTLSGCHDITICNDVTIGDHAYIADSHHDYKDPGLGIQPQPLIVGRIHIGRNAWVGYGAVVAGNVTIGEHAVIGANSVVTRSVPAFTVVAGAPARVIREYDPEMRIWVRPRPRDGAPDEQAVRDQP